MGIDSLVKDGEVIVWLSVSWLVVWSGTCGAVAMSSNLAAALAAHVIATVGGSCPGAGSPCQ